MPVLLLYEQVSWFILDKGSVCFVIDLSDNCSLHMYNYLIFFFKELWHPVTKESSSYSCENISNNKCCGFYCSVTYCNTGRWEAL